MEVVGKTASDEKWAENLSIVFGELELNLDVPVGVWTPTPHGKHLGHMLTQIDFSGEHVLELGSGCGIHTILIAKQNAAEMTVTELDQEVLDNTCHNLKKYQINIPIHYQVADWTHVDGGPFDSLVANPPFAKSGKTYRRYFIETLINDAHKLLKPGGRLIFVQSSMADIKRSQRLMADWAMEVKVIGESRGSFRDYYYEDKKFMKEIELVENSYEMIDGAEHETLVVFEARLL